MYAGSSCVRCSLSQGKVLYNMCLVGKPSSVSACPHSLKAGECPLHEVVCIYVRVSLSSYLCISADRAAAAAAAAGAAAKPVHRCSSLYQRISVKRVYIPFFFC